MSTQADLGDAAEASFDKSPKQGLSGMLQPSASEGPEGEREGMLGGVEGQPQGLAEASTWLQEAGRLSCKPCSLLLRSAPC